MDSTIASLHAYLFIGVATLFIFQSLMLFTRSRKNRVKVTMASLELVWAMAYISSLVMMSTAVSVNEFSYFRARVLIVGSFYITFTHFFPVQVLVPGWLNLKRMFLMLLPNILLAVIYWGGVALLGEESEDMLSYGMIIDSIGHFNVWFRFVILFSNIVYMVWILRWLYGYEKKYNQWKNENYSDQEYVEISWLRSYDYIIIGISFFYIAILFVGGRIPVMCHSVFVIISFSYLFYKTLFYESPYAEFVEQEDKTADENVVPDNLVSVPAGQEIQDECTFEGKIPAYIAILKEWMETDRPYLYNDFKLTDVSRLLPLNRSYLSRVVNEGFDCNFSELVRSYRVNYAKDVLRENPTMPMYKVAEKSGFRSDVTFVKAFKQVVGMTPSQYKTQEMDS